MFYHNMPSLLSAFILSSNIILTYYNLFTVAAFTNIQPSHNQNLPPTVAFHRQQCTYYAKPKNKSFFSNEEPAPKEEIIRPVNEFSRIVRVDSVLSSGSSRRTRDYSIFIEANSEELQGLAKRFQLPEFTKLEADLVLKKESGAKSGTGELIQAEGTVTASLSQICYRTNIPFETELSFQMFAAVRNYGPRDDISITPPTESPANFRPRKNKRSSRKKVSLSNTGGNSIIDDLSMQEIQGMLEDVDLVDDAIEDDVIEDDGVFQNGNLDVGELVAQMFRLKLDPFPKKPGTKPVNITYSA